MARSPQAFTLQNGSPTYLSNFLNTAGCNWFGFAGRAFALDDTAFAVLVIQVATPVAVTSYLIAEKYQADAESVAGLVVVSTLVSVLALPALLAVLL